jgi:selenocysteine lyase/cysteine desulfurase
LIGAQTSEIALIPTVSNGVGMVAASLKAGDSVVVPEAEFTSVLYPILVAAQERGIAVSEVPYDALAESIEEGTTLVAFSLTQSQSGRRARLADICEAGRAKGAKVLVDATHSIPFVPVADQLDKIDFLVCHGYKHLLCPRGVAFFYVRQDRWNDVPPILANWRAGAPRYARSYGGPLALAEDAARFDVSLAWHSWAGAKPALELLVQWQDEGQFERVLGLSDRLAAGLGLPKPTSSIVTMAAPDAEAAEVALNQAGVRCAARAGNVRLSPHVYNTEEEIDRAVEALRSI